MTIRKTAYTRAVIPFGEDELQPVCTDVMDLFVGNEVSIEALVTYDAATAEMKSIEELMKYRPTHSLQILVVPFLQTTLAIPSCGL